MICNVLLFGKNWSKNYTQKRKEVYLKLSIAFFSGINYYRMLLFWINVNKINAKICGSESTYGVAEQTRQTTLPGVSRYSPETAHTYKLQSEKKPWLAAFWPILVFFFKTSWLPILLKILIFLGFIYFSRGWFFCLFYFLEIEKTFVNKKVPILNSWPNINFYWIMLDTFLKNPLAIFRGFSSISPKVLEKCPWKSVWYLL